MSRVLFVYPNKEGYPIIPLGISILAGILKNNGHIVELFDVTFMVPERLDHKARIKTKTVIEVDMEKYWGKGDNLDIQTEFKKKLNEFKPDLIAFSIVENNYGLAKKLFGIVKAVSKSPIIVGGTFPTVAPKFFLNDKNIDIICIGEGEYALQELVRRIDKKEDICGVPNLIIKNKGNPKPVRFAKYYDWHPFVNQDWDIFDARHIFRPFIGKIWRTGFFELSRGCPFSCTYCMNQLYQQKFKALGNYRREKPIDYAIKEMEYMKKKYSLELIFFNDENFMMMSEARFVEFCDGFIKKVNIPFFIQTKAETLLDESRVKMLKDIGCITTGIGIETGSEEIRKKLLNKSTPNEIYKQAFDAAR